MIYLDNAATTMQKPQEVIQAVTYALNHLGNSGRGAYENSLDASRLIFEARTEIAEFFGCSQPSHVVFTANATEALNTVLFGTFQPGNHVITTVTEHNSVLRPFYSLMEQGIEVSFVPADDKGNISTNEMEKLIRPNTKAIVVCHASNLTGNCNPLKEIAKLTKNRQLLLIVDASQSAGILPIHMKEDGIDILCFTGHKSLMGPQGTGGICIETDVPIRPLKSGGTGVQTYLKEQPQQLPTRLEAGTLNGHGIAGLLAGIRFLTKQGLGKVQQHDLSLMRLFYDGVKEIEGVTIYGDFDKVLRAPIVTLNIRDYDSTEVADELANRFEIAVRAGAHCAPLMHEALGTVEQGAVRFSFGFYNTKEEVQEAIRAIRELASEEN